MKLPDIISRILDSVFVLRCACCGELLSEGERVLCRTCRVKYDMQCHRKCKSCGADICLCDCTKEGLSSHGVWRISKLCAYVPSETASPFKAMLFRLKNKNDSDVRELFATELAELIRKRLPDYKDCTLCFVPRSRASQRKYGYDHMKELTSSLSDKLGIPSQSLFERDGRAKVQKELGRTARFENTQKSIKLREEYRGCGFALKHRRFILVDDVCVTGASLGRCATLLISEGAEEVRCFVLGTRP